tara:strand:- start:318 stop:1940 length:1623 start_codon:yes stop_codon:yes gene_type:complete
MNYFAWTEKSKKRNQQTLRHEPVQPFTFLGFLEYAQVQVVLDVGANVGYYALHASLVNSVERIYAFEPDISAFNELKKNIALNGLSGQIYPLLEAVSEVTGNVEFGTHAPMSGVNSVVDSSIHDADLFSNVSVLPSIKLDEIEYIRGKVLGIKIDVEGHELKVLTGAMELLSQNPVIIQIEHFLEDEIDEFLTGLGFFRFFAAGYDHYFSNIKNFANQDFVHQAVMFSITCMIEASAGRWPNNKTIKDSLSLSFSVFENKLQISALVDNSFFDGELEFAFYYIEDGERKDTRWYDVNPSATFFIDNNATDVEVKGFVREIGFIDKKVAKSVYVKQPKRGLRPESAVDSNLALPDRWSAVSNQCLRKFGHFSDLDISSLLVEISHKEPSEVLYIGMGKEIVELARQLRRNGKGRLIILCDASQLIILNNFVLNEPAIRPWVSVFCVSSCDSYDAFYDSLTFSLGNVEFVILRDQFLADIGKDYIWLKTIFLFMRNDGKFFSEAFAHKSHRDHLLAIAQDFSVELEFLYPKSSILGLVNGCL